MKYIIEHLEPKLYKWCQIEYKHISSIIGKDNLIFTNIKTEAQQKNLQNFGKVEKRSISELNYPRMTVLDPSAQQTLSPNDKERFDYLVFGGILGDHPMKQRTKKELTSKLAEIPIRNLGPKQFPTDNAIFIAREIVEKGKTLNDLSFTENIELELRKGESILFPFCYLLISGKPLISEELKFYLRKRRRI